MIAPHRPMLTSVPAFRMETGSGFALPCSLVLGAILFNAALCFVNTRGLAISESTIMLAEFVILSATFAASFRAANATSLLVMVVCVLYLSMIIATRTLAQGTSADVKIVRDLMIPVAFFLLGLRTANMHYADRLVTWSAVTIGIGAVFEFFFLNEFLKYFDVIMFYVAKGAVEAARLSILSTKLFVSGMRPEGRTLLPFLGDHRVSSFFLEPVSLGNYGVILFFWAVVRLRSAGSGLCLAWAVAAILLVIAADSRFGTYLCIIGTLLALVPMRFRSPVLALAPLLVVALVLGFASALPDGIADDSLVGRLLSSGRLLARFDWANWFGLGAMPWQGFDSGYAYVIGRIGLPGFVGLWCMLMLIPCKDMQSRLNQHLVGLYLGAILSISYSPLTIKTASLLWFLFGTSVASAAKDSQTTPARATTFRAAITQSAA